MRVLFVAVAVILVACGGNRVSADEYPDAARDALATMDTDTVAELMTDVDAEPALLLNDDWKRDMIAAMETWQDAHRQARELDPDDDAEDAHAAVLDASECMSDLADQMIPLVEDEDTRVVIVAADLIPSCVSMMRDARRELDTLEDAE